MRRSIAIFALLLSASLAFGTAYRTVAAHSQSCNNPDDCNGNGGSGGSGGCGGGMCGDGGSGGNSPEPSNGGNGSATGGNGGPGNGTNGDAGNNNIRTPTPSPQPVSNSSSGSGSGTSKSSLSSSPGATPAPDASLESWARQLNTTPEEIQSWFGTYSANDTIGGQANAISVHPDDQLTIFDGATTAETQNSGTESPRRMGIHGIGGTRTKGGDGVDVSMHSTAVPLGSTVTDAGGAFTANVQIPHDTTEGRHFIVALAPNAKEGRAAFVFPVSVEASAAAAPAADTQSEPTSTGKRFPWVLLELIVGSASVVALFIYRVRRASAA